jgi:hypothetical protein
MIEYAILQISLGVNINHINKTRDWKKKSSTSAFSFLSVITS